jgi:hypothetical protein
MTRDDDLIRKLMLVLEQASGYINDNLVVEGYSRDQVAHHLGRIVRAATPKVRNTATCPVEAIQPSPGRSG